MNSSCSGQVTNFKWKAILSGIIATLFVSFLGGIIISAIYYFTSLSENTFPWLSYGLLFLSAFCGGALAGKKAGRKGLVYGFFLGLSYFLLILFFSTVFLSTPIIFPQLLFKLLAIIIGAILGGILGIGL